MHYYYGNDYQQYKYLFYYAQILTIFYSITMVHSRSILFICKLLSCTLIMLLLILYINSEIKYIVMIHNVLLCCLMGIL